jgi:hypothetical protein
MHPTPIVIPDRIRKNIREFKYYFRTNASCASGIGAPIISDPDHISESLETNLEISQIIKDYFCLPFFLLIILWGKSLKLAGNLLTPNNIYLQYLHFKI